MPRQPGPAAAPDPSSSNAWKIAAVVGVLVLGCIFGTVLAMTNSGPRHTQTSAQASSDQDSKSGFNQAFDASFRASCRQSAMRAGNISQASADNYCECALPIFKQTHDLGKAVASCSKYAIRW